MANARVAPARDRALLTYEQIDTMGGHEQGRELDGIALSRELKMPIRSAQRFLSLQGSSPSVFT